MRAILEDLDRWWRDGEKLAVATLVRARGSTPRAPGARLCVTRSGKMTGSVSGGCVETDVFERAQQVLDTGEPVVATYGVADDAGLRVGLTCGGAIDVLIEPVTSAEPWRTIARAQQAERPVGVAVALEPRVLLGRSLVIVDGEICGSIDPRLDGVVGAEVGRLAVEGGTSILERQWKGREEEAIIFLEAFSPPPNLIMVGAAHTAVALAAMAKTVGFRVIVIDPRSTIATRERFPSVDQIVHEWPASALARLRLDARAHVVVLAHDPKLDIPALACALRSRAVYVGAIGSRATSNKRKQLLGEDGFTKADLERIRSPIGMDIGAREPEEIALAILAEMMAVRSGRDGRPLKNKQEPIHGGP